MSDIQEALDWLSAWKEDTLTGKYVQTLATAYRETKAEADKYYFDLCIKTRTANRERQKHKQWLKEARRLQKAYREKYDELEIVRYDRDGWQTEFEAVKAQRDKCKENLTDCHMRGAHLLAEIGSYRELENRYNRLLKVAIELYDSLNKGEGRLEAMKHYEWLQK